MPAVWNSLDRRKDYFGGSSNDASIDLFLFFDFDTPSVTLSGASTGRGGVETLQPERNSPPTKSSPMHNAVRFTVGNPKSDEWKRGCRVGKTRQQRDFKLDLIQQCVGEVRNIAIASTAERLEDEPARIGRRTGDIAANPFDRTVGHRDLNDAGVIATHLVNESIFANCRSITR